MFYMGCGRFNNYGMAMELNDSTCFLVLQRIFGMLLNKPIQRQKMLPKSMM
jgi:hypothetical protein